jgi:hypothetical protein
VKRVVHLELREVHLHGIDPRDRHAVSDALQAELGALLAAHVPPRLMTSIDRVSITHSAPRGADPVSLGRSVATALAGAGAAGGSTGRGGRR